MQVFPQLLHSVTESTAFATLHDHPLNHQVIFLYLCIAGLDRDLISLEIVLYSLQVYWMERLFTTHVSSALKTQHTLLQLGLLLLFQTSFYIPAL